MNAVAVREAQIRAIQIVVLALFFGGWFVITQTRAVNPLFLPPIGAVAHQVARIAASGQLWRAAAVTAQTVGEAYALAVIAGVGVGFFLGRSRRLSDAFEPVLSGIFAIPITLFFPLFVVLFGIGPNSKVAFGAVYAFFPIALNTIAGFNAVDRLYLRSARSLGATAWQTFRHIYLRGALPVVLSGLRIGFFICFASVLGGETLSSAAGVGHAIAHAAELLNSGEMYAWIVFVLAATIALNLLLSAVETRASRA